MRMLFGIVLLVVLAAATWQALRRRAAERSRPGGRPETAIAVRDFGEIDIAARQQTCPCGGHFGLRGEGPAHFAGRPLRMVTLECGRCERERRLYFDLAQLRH